MTPQQQERDRGRAYARNWRKRMKPAFDAMYGPEVCDHCGQPALRGRP